MKTLRYWALFVAAGLIGPLGNAQAAEPLSKDQVTALISGSKVTQRLTDPSTKGSGLVEYGADGRVTNTHTGTKHRGVIETGTWQVTEKGELCVTWQGKSQPNCDYLVPTGHGGYYLTKDPAKTGKREITAVSK